MKRPILLFAAGLCAASASSAAMAHVDVGVFLGVPAPVYVQQPPVIYQPPVVYAPAPVYYDGGYGYGYGGEYRDERRWHDNGRHRGWEHHRHEDDD